MSVDHTLLRAACTPSVVATSSELKRSNSVLVAKCAAVFSTASLMLAEARAAVMALLALAMCAPLAGILNTLTKC
jgi:hypothetical protein